MSAQNRMRAIHPGEILREEYLLPLDMSANALAKAIDVPANRITTILNAERALTADTALRLAKFFNTTPAFWLNLQLQYDLRVAEDTRELRKAVAAIEPLPARRVG